MDDYRAIHRARYLEREKERTEKLEKIERLKTLVESIETHTNMRQIQGTVQEISDTLPDVVLDKDELTRIGLRLVEVISANQFTKTDFNHHVQVQMSQDVHGAVKNILNLCGIDDTIEVQYDMDCSRDEEIAQELAREPPPPIARRPRGRPRRVR